MSDFALEKTQIQESIDALRLFMKEHTVHGMNISSFDPWLNEYVPLVNCHRYYITGFTGSVAETFVPLEGRVKLYVDGRYHEQADNEVDHDLIEVVKCIDYVDMQNQLINDIANNLNPKMTLGLEGDRCPLSWEYRLQNLCQVKTFDGGECATNIFKSKIDIENQITPIGIDFTGEKVTSKLQRFCAAGEARFVTQLDTLAWLSNCRGYQLPYQSVFIAKGLVCSQDIYLFISDLSLVDDIAKDLSGVHFIECQNAIEMGQHVQKIISKKSIQHLYYSGEQMTGADFRMLKSSVGNLIDLRPDNQSQSLFHAIKNESELATVASNFQKGDQVIFKSLMELKDAYANDNKLSEKEFFDLVGENYKAAGAKGLSFRTIVGYDANGSVIHYGDPKNDVYLKENGMVLMDSGAFFDGGYATDTTRTVFIGDKPSDEQKIMYTLVLKGLIRAESATFLPGTWGASIDALARMAMMKFGQNYAHGTGHGVGINVHEAGYSVRPHSTVPLSNGLVGSIEPGIYLPGQFGIRLENIVTVQHHPDFPEYLCFRPLVFIGFDPNLTIVEMLDKDELSYLKDYENECLSRGTSFGLNTKI